jgi:methanogenic corrinoid protein MtbC1
VLVLSHEAAGIVAHRRETRAMLAAVEGEQHVVALDMGAKLLESAGYEVLTLGPDVPIGDLAGVITDHSPALVALTATMPETGERVPAAIDAITEADAGIGLILGGTSVPPALLPDPRVIVETSVAGIVDAADRLVRRAGLN